MRLLLVYIADMYKFTRAKFIVNITLMVVLGMLEGIGILMIIPLLIVAGIIPGMQATSGITFWLKDLFQYAGVPLTLPVVLVIYTGVNIGQSWLQRYQATLNVSIQQSFNTYLDVRFFRAVAYARWQVLMSITRSDIANTLLMELDRVYVGIGLILKMFSMSIIALIQIVIAFMVAPGLTCLVIGGALVLSIILRPLYGESSSIGENISTLNTDLMSNLLEQLSGLKEVKSYGIESAQVEKFTKTRNMLKNNSIRFSIIQSRTGMFYNIGATIFISLCLFFAVEVFHLDSQEFILIAYIGARLWPSLSSFQSWVQQIMTLLPGFSATKNMEDKCLAAAEQLSDEVVGSRMELSKGVEFCQVSFSYDGERSDHAVDNASFVLPANSTTAFVGVSGAGKSTLVDLLIGLLTPKAGKILVDGEYLCDRLLPWRNSIGYVPQDPFLFNASIKENLLWARAEASDEEIWEALRSASADLFVSNLPDGLDTIVGDRGLALSGGERQRIVLARALLRKPSVLVLDEATSSLDSENEKRIKSAIEGLRGRMTIVIIAHRISTIRNADRIFVMEQGRIVEQGNYQTLMANIDSRFCALAC